MPINSDRRRDGAAGAPDEQSSEPLPEHSAELPAEFPAESPSELPAGPAPEASPEASPEANTERPIDEPIGQPIGEMIAAGRHADAAACARAQGDPLRAAGLYERIWEFGLAAECAREGGDLPRALRNALDARDEAQVAAIAAMLDARGAGGVRAAMEVFALRRRFGDAAVRAEAAGELELAIDYYRKAHHELDAARLLVEVGRDHEAGRLLERMVEVAAPGRELAQAQLALGQLLVRRMQYASAAAHLQEAVHEPATRAQARRSLILALAGMGLRDAARDVLVGARADDPELPADLDSYLRAAREAGEPRAGSHAPRAGAEDAGAGSAPAAPRARDEEPEIIGGRYRLAALLGAGGSGRVHRAHDEATGHVVAIKIFSLSRDHQAYERFVREARVTGGLRHANLVEVYDFSAEQGYLVMEHMAGGSLAERLQRGEGEGSRPMRGVAVRRMALDVLAGLERAHRRGIIHRDIKPANIFFDARGTAKLGDFGVAHLLDLGQTQTGGLIGTLAYMAPEQITGAPLTIAADLYALGVTMYEALTGRLPFLGPDFVAQHLGETPPPASSALQDPPDEAGAELVPGWDEILARLLSKSPGERFESVDALRKALQALDLDRGPRLLVLPRRASTAGGGRAGDDGGSLLAGGLVDAAEPGDDTGEAADEERYRFETPIGRTDISRLGRALDAVLDRSVIIERHHEGALDQATERRLHALARGGSPFVQWALAHDRAAGVTVFEAPSGEPLADAIASAPLPPAAAVRLLMGLARAVAPMHERGVAHGAIGATTVVIDEQQNPTVIICGLGRAPVTPPHPRDDVIAILRLVARAAGVDMDAVAIGALAAGLVDALAPGLSQRARAAVLASEPVSGEELYAFAERLEVAVLQSR